MTKTTPNYGAVIGALILGTLMGVRIGMVQKANPPKCYIQHAYVEGDVVMVTDVAEPLAIVSLVCHDGRWEVLK